MIQHRLRAATLAAAVLACVMAATAGVPAQLRIAPVGERADAAALDLLLRQLSSSGTFMQTDAHPDDEDNGLLAMLGYGQGMRVALVTATRGDGGQNEIGPELGQALGVLRTEELLAVHRFDGAEQYFTRAIDFGYSFSVEESVQQWGEDQIVGDLVRLIRTIRPDVVAGFLCGGTAGGLHHQASAKLTLEAFRAAGDPAKYPEQVREGLRPWQPARIFCTDETSFAPQPGPLTRDKVRPDLSAFDSIIGRSYAELGLEARSMHRCQGTSQLLLLPGASPSRTYKWQDGDVNGTMLFDGIDTSIVGLTRFAGAADVAALRGSLSALQHAIADARSAQAAGGAGATVAPLAAGLYFTRALRTRVARLSSGAAEIDFRLAQKERQFQDALLAASGTRLDALADDGVVTPGQALTVTLAGASGIDGVELTSVTLAGFDGAPQPVCTGTLGRGASVSCKAMATIPASTHLSTPYWTPRRDAARYDFEPDVPFGVPFRPSPFHAIFSLRIGSADVTVDRVVQYRYSNPIAGEKRSELHVSPAFNVGVDPAIAVFPRVTPPASARASAASSAPPVVSAFRRKTITVTVGNNQKGGTAATVTLNAPAGWTVTPASAAVGFVREDEEARVTFTLDAPAALAPGEWPLSARVTAAGGAESTLGYQVVEYPHIHRRHVVAPAVTRVKVIDASIAPNRKVGYIMGSGDRVPEAIAQLGAEVHLIDADALASGDLSAFDVIMVGVRAYERRPDLRAGNQRLLDYARTGGTVIVQYQRTEFNAAQYGPYPAKTTDARVTDENAPMIVLAPDHPVFTAPNRIGPDTWAGWVQERGTYFMGERDARYVDLLRSADPFPYNAGDKTGILIEARVGRGRWLYTGLGLWRQLPAGVDGAYRLLANLLSLGRESGPNAK